MSKVAEQELLALRSRFFESALDICAISDRSGRLADVNEAFVSAFGYTKEELVGETWAHYIHEADAEASEREFEKIIETSNSSGFMSRLRCKDGEYKLVEWDTSICPITNMVMSVGRDISDARKSYETLNANISLQRAIIDSADFAIISTDGEGVIQTFNRRAERMLGYSAKEVIGKSTPQNFFDADELLDYTDELSKGFGAGVAKGVEVLFAKARAGLVEEGKFTLTKKSGHVFPAQVSIGALRNDSSEIYAFLIVARDVTMERRVENMKNEFISTVSHELRTPMTSIKGSLGLVSGGLAGEIPDEAKKLIDMAIASSERLIRLVNDILDIEKIDSGKMDLVYKTVEVAPLVEQAIRSNQTFGDKHSVRFKFSNSVTTSKIKVDVDRFAQILDNLLSNAAKYTTEGDEVDVQLNQSGDRIRVSVIDHGKGIPDSFKPKVFTKFMQANSSDKRKKGGTGLGLAICKSLVEHQGGTIDFESEEGKGTTFFFEFPTVNG